jgi:thiosulfate dehydrogenase [quinone] large subunit
MSITRSSYPVTERVGVHPELAELGADRRAKAVAGYAGAIARFGLSFIFLWAFFDKLFGWGKATPSKNSWLNGGSPTTGFLSHAKGPFGNVFQHMSGVAVYDWLFMAALLGIGAALAFGIGLRIAAISGVLLMVMMWAASLPLASNPILDDHLIYAVVLVWIAAASAGRTLGLATWWERQALVQRLPILR